MNDFDKTVSFGGGMYGNREGAKITVFVRICMKNTLKYMLLNWVTVLLLIVLFLL